MTLNCDSAVNEADLSYHSYTKEGNFNWKAFIDGYQECYRMALLTPF
jgi:hypothetical protein